MLREIGFMKRAEWRDRVEWPVQIVRAGDGVGVMRERVGGVSRNEERSVCLPAHWEAPIVRSNMWSRR